METLAAKVPPDLSEKIERYREEHGLNRSQAIRRLIEDGLEADELRDELEARQERDERTIAITKPAAVALLGWFMIGVDWLTVQPGQPIGAIGTLVVVVAIVYSIAKSRGILG